MEEIVLATRNINKVKEIKEILKGLNIKLLSLENFPHAPEVKEDGKTFAENAVKKAKEIAKYTQKLALAEDSGIEVNYLRGSPGLHSSRFAANDKARVNKLLRLLEGVPESKRGAKFKCAVALANHKGWVKVAEGSCQGKISLKVRGYYGFGYDPIFLIPKYNRTFGELGYPLKNEISHRAKALRKTKKTLTAIKMSDIL